MEQAMLAAVEKQERTGGYRYFEPRGAVRTVGEQRQVFVAGTLVGMYDVSDKATRNALVVELSLDRWVHLGQIAGAFELGEEQLRRLRERHAAQGLAAIMEIRRGGRQAKLTPELRRKLHGLFDAGLTIEKSREKIRKHVSVSRAVVGRAHKAWARQREQPPLLAPADAPASASPLVPEQLPLHIASTSTDVEFVPAEARTETVVAAGLEGDDAAGLVQATPSVEASATDEIATESALADAPPTTPVGPSLHGAKELQSDAILDGRPQHVQHAGSWLLLVLMHAMGLYRHAEALRLAAVREGEVDGRHLGATALRVAFDAAIITLGIGQQCIEGVRRIATPTAKTLLRIGQAVPPPSWVREVLGRFAQARGQLLHTTTMFSLIARARRETEPRAWFYVDNHMRPYTGKQTVRKGWRMQDKRVLPGSSDYWVHDEDGRPLLRFSSPSHEAMTERLRPIARMLRAGLDEAGAKNTKIALVFDRAGAFPTEMAAVRDEGFEFVTYERGPYPKILTTEFDSEFTVRGETLRYVELHQKNLRSNRGRVRRVHLLAEDGHQFNVLACSEVPAEELVRALFARWGCQENQFKYGVERLGFNQLDGRSVEHVDPDEQIPNPARRRLLRALGVARQLEGEALRKLTHLPPSDSRRQRWEQELARSRELQKDFEAQRPDLPKKVRVGDSELAGKLVRHKNDYKLVVDTIRILIANIESELASLLGPHLARPAEAKKTVTNLFAAPAVVRATKRAIMVDILPAGTRRELKAFDALLACLNDQRLTLPGDPGARPLRFRTHLEGDASL